MLLKNGRWLNEQNNVLSKSRRPQNFTWKLSISKQRFSESKLLSWRLLLRHWELARLWQISDLPYLSTPVSKSVVGLRLRS